MQAKEEIEKILNSYINEINSIDDAIWCGTSKNHFVESAIASIDECKTILSSQLSNLESAMTYYDSWKQAQRMIQYIDSILARATESTPERVINNHRENRNEWQRKANNYANEIKRLLETIKNSKIEEKELTSSNGFVKFYKKDYADVSYGYGTTVSETGGGPVSMAMVISTLTDKEVSPAEAASWSLEHGYRCEGNGTYWSYFDAYAKKNGLNCTQSNVNSESIIDNLKNGNPIIMSVKEGTYTNEGQFIVLTGITEDGKIEIVDPSSEEKSQITYDLDLFMNEGTQQWVISN